MIPHLAPYQKRYFPIIQKNTRISSLIYFSLIYKLQPYSLHILQHTARSLFRISHNLTIALPTIAPSAL